MRWRRLVVVLLVAALAACAGPGSERVVVAAGTTLVDSGLIDALAATYEADNPGIEISIVAEPTALALELGRQEAADLLLVHAPDLEREFVADGFASISLPFVTSRFVLIGPPELGDRFGGKSSEEVFSSVAAEALPFVSRADGSGTNERELAIWEMAGVDPVGASWYIETGQGMGPTIQVADQREAITLSEYGAFVAAGDNLGLVDLDVVSAALENPYTGHVVAGAANESGAAAFLDWLTSPDGSDEVTKLNEQLFGELIYQPASQ